MADVTPNHALPFLEGTDPAADVDQGLQDLAERLDAIIVVHDAGTLAARPVSTPESPGTAGRTYRITTGESAGVVFMDTGTSWIAIGRRPAGEISDSELESPSNSVYRTLLNQSSIIKSSAVLLGGTPYILGTQAAHTQPDSSGSDISNVANASFHPIFFKDDDFTVAGKTQKLRLRAQVCVNGTSWTSVAATFGLYPVSFAGGTGELSVTLGTVVPDSTVEIANPTNAGNPNEDDSGDFTIPADGQYCLGVLLSALPTTNSVAILSAQLQTRHV